MSQLATTTIQARSLAVAAICPDGADIRMALLKPGAVSDYGPDFARPYSKGMGGNEVEQGNGYTRGGQRLSGRKAGVTGERSWVSFDSPVWHAVGQLSAGGAVVYDATNGSRIVGFIGFEEKTASDGDFIVQIPGGDSGGLVGVT